MKKDSENLGSISVARFEVWHRSGDPKEIRKRWHELREHVQRAVNCIWETWLVWHVQNESAAKIRKHLDALAKWREKDKVGGAKKNKPKLSVLAVDKKLSKVIYDTLDAEFPQLNGRTRELVRNATISKIKTRKAAKGNLSGWMAILLHNESLPSSTRPLPIPFDKANGDLRPPMNKGDNFTVRVRIDRIGRDGKPATSTVDEIELLTKRKGMASQAAILHRITNGEYAFRGSSLLWDDSNKKWFCLICYRMPAGADKPAGKGVAILRPNRRGVIRPDRHGDGYWCQPAPWTLFVAGDRRARGGRGSNVSHVRQTLLTQRWGRQENYRFSGSANKGRGRKRAMDPVFKLSERWKDFVKTANHQLTTSIVQECVRDGIATLAYWQPTGEKRDSRLLATAGKVPGRRDSTGWDWHQVATMLGYKCKKAGIHLIVRRCGKGMGGEGVLAIAGH